MWKRNLIVLIVAVIAMPLLGFLGSVIDPFRRMNVPSELSVAIAVVIFLLTSIGAFLGFGGGFWTRTILATVSPAIAFPLAELAYIISGVPDDGYRGLSITVGALLAMISFLGCVFIGGPIFLWRQHQNERHLTTRSKSDAVRKRALARAVERGR